MPNPSLAEKIKRLLPGEQNKRIRIAIMEAATAGTSAAIRVKNQIDQENRLKDGKLQDGTLEFPDSTTAELDLFVWVLDYQIFQPGFTTLPVIEHDPDFPRPDIFTGDNAGNIKYYPGTIDSEGNGQFPDIPEGEVILREVLRNTDGSNDSTPGNGGGNGKYVSLNDTGTQVVKSFLGSEPLAGTLRDSLYPDANGVFRKTRVDYHGVYSTVEGVGATDWSKIVTINVAGGQLRYFVMLEFAGVSPAMEKGMVWIQFETDGAGDLTVNKLKVFGEINPAKLKMVKLDANTYAVFVHHNEAGAFFKFRPQFSFGGSTVYDYHHQDGRAALPAGTQYEFALVAAKEVEMSTNATHIIWRLVGDSSWTDLIAIADITGPQGDPGADGAPGSDGSDGLNGWTPILAVVSDGVRRVQQVVDWTGGSGTKPSTGQYVGATGLEVDIANGVDIRGAEGPPGSGGGSGAYLTDLDTWPILKFDKNYRYVHEMTGPIEISAHMLAPLPVPGNFNILYIKANGVNKPDFTDVFEVIWDNWNNTAGYWNRVYPEYTPEGKVILQIEQAHLGTANDGSGSNTITVKFDANYVQQHIISASTQIVIDSTDAEVGFETILFVKSDGVNKPFWDSDDVVMTYDNYINLANVWNRFKLEWRPENKAILQIMNT